jgi:hypothetical protein
VPFLITSQHWKALRTLCELSSSSSSSSSSVSFIGKISPNFNLKNMISTYTQVFYHGENGARIRQILKKENSKLQDFKGKFH